MALLGERSCAPQQQMREREGVDKRQKDDNEVERSHPPFALGFRRPENLQDQLHRGLCNRTEAFEAAILYRFGDVLGRNRRGAREIGDRPSDPRDPVERTCRELPLGTR